jgi:hypothetical protein
MVYSYPLWIGDSYCGKEYGPYLVFTESFISPFSTYPWQQAPHGSTKDPQRNVECRMWECLRSFLQSGRLFSTHQVRTVVYRLYRYGAVRSFTNLMIQEIRTVCVTF